MMTSVNDMPSNYHQAATRLGRNDEKTIANNTRLRRVSRVIEDDGTTETVPGIAVVLHSTQIVVHWLDGMVTLNSGGWKTSTTKARMNAALPAGFRVRQERREWFVDIRRGGEWLSFDFADGDMWDTNPENVVR